MSHSITCIYLIKNKINNKVYIGQAVNYNRRIKEHKSRYNNKTEKTERNFLYRAMRKYGIENFDFSILQECPVSELNNLEQFYITKYDSLNNGYNMTAGGQNDQPNKKLNEEDVIFIRTLYGSRTRMSNREIWERYFKNKITFKYFRNLWRGMNWSHIMPEVFTEENKQYYISKNTGVVNQRASFSDDEVVQLRKRYRSETAPSIHQDYQDRITLRGMEAILRGQTYKHLPIYKKQEKCWVLNNQIVKETEVIVNEEN